MKTERLDSIWREQEAREATGSGLLRTRYTAEAKLDIFIGLKIPTQQRMLMLGLRPENIPFETRLPELNGIKISVTSDPENENRKLLAVLLNDELYRDLFSVLAQDIIDHILQVDREHQAGLVLRRRLEKWQTFLEQYRPEGLSNNAQMGLFGELSVLKKLLHTLESPAKCTEAWIGPAGSDQDFQAPGWAIEVKTHSGKIPQQIRVSSERQLEGTSSDDLLLYYLHLDVRPGTQFTLPGLVQSVREDLSSSDEMYALSSFNERLHQAGYHDHQAHLYETRTYAIKSETIYTVEPDFPRITPDDLPPGVSDVSYSLNLSMCTSFELSEEQFTTRLKRHV